MAGVEEAEMTQGITESESHEYVFLSLIPNSSGKLGAMKLLSFDCAKWGFSRREEKKNPKPGKMVTTYVICSNCNICIFLSLGNNELF